MDFEHEKCIKGNDNEMNEAVRYLSNDKIRNIAMLEVLRRGKCKILFQEDTGILIFDENSSIYMMSCTNIDTASKIIGIIPNDAELVLAHESFYVNLLKNKFNVEDTLKCNNVVYTKKNYIENNENEVEIKILKYEDLLEIEKLYSSVNLVGGTEYIKGRIDSEEMIGAFVDGELVGFIGFHEEGSIGMLEVKEEYRRRGIGEILEKEAINNALKLGKYPYGQVVVGNDASLKLQKKLGLEISDKRVYWIIK